jgi:hypothetical protein
MRFCQGTTALLISINRTTAIVFPAAYENVIVLFRLSISIIDLDKSTNMVSDCNSDCARIVDRVHNNFADILLATA